APGMPRALASRCRLVCTASGTSPTCAPRLNSAYGPWLAPPHRSVTDQSTPKRNPSPGSRSRHLNTRPTVEDRSRGSGGGLRGRRPAVADPAGVVLEHGQLRGEGEPEPVAQAGLDAVQLRQAALQHLLASLEVGEDTGPLRLGLRDEPLARGAGVVQQPVVLLLRGAQ